MLSKAAPNFTENAVKDFFKKVISTEPFSVTPDAVSINIFPGDYSNLMHLNKCNGTAI